MKMKKKAMKKEKETLPLRRLPDGTTTTSGTRYVKSWRQAGKPLERLLGYRLYAFDPDMAFVDCHGRHALALPIHVVLTLNTVLSSSRESSKG